MNMKNKIYWVMVMILTLHFSLFTCDVAAQPKARRAEQQKKEQKTTATNVSLRSQLSFPTAMPMSEDVVWRRDLYREIVLEDKENSALYYPDEPRDNQVNLFTYMFKLMLSGKLKVYEYRLDGNELFTDSARIKPLELLDKYDIYYERNGKSIRIEPSDIPSHDVKSYFIKESAYYDQASSTFHKKVTALCPVMKRDDGFGEATSYPLFWVKYDDLAPFLAKHTLMTSDFNNAATMSADDYFTKNMYKGKIYKTNNMLGKTLAQVANGDEKKILEEQQKIEAEIAAFEKGLFNTNKKVEAQDSIEVEEVKVVSKQKKQPKTSTTSTSRRTAAKEAKEKKTTSSGLSARRQRR